MVSKMKLWARVFGLPNGAKNDPNSEKTTENRSLSGTRCFHRFGGAWDLKNGSPEPSQTICFPTSKRKSAFLTRSSFCIDVGTHLAPFWHRFGREINEHPKNYPARIRFQKPSVFRICFLSVWEPFWLLFPRDFRPEDLPRRHENLPKSCSSP